MKTIVLINGKMRSGKDFVGQLLKQELEANGKTVETMSFAGPLKQIMAATFGISLGELDEYKNAKYTITYNDGEESHYLTDFRTLLQRFGTEGAKPVFGDKIWAELGSERAHYSEADFVIFTDFRFDVEYEEFYDYCNLSRNSRLVTIKVLGGEDGSTHSSETGPAIKFDYCIDNTTKDHTALQEVKELVNTLVK